MHMHTYEYSYEIERKHYSFDEMLDCEDTNKKRFLLKLLENNVEIECAFFEHYDDAEIAAIEWLYKNELPY